MITRLGIENFQSIESAAIELGRFTVLVGPSNSGKSAIRRAIEALVNNDPPAGRLREGAQQYIVAFEVDGTFVSMTKGKKNTSYHVRDVSIDKPGATCPPAVADVLRLSETNFASQFDLPYLLAETPSTVARSLGELTNISVLFEGIREATRRQREAGKRAKVLNEQVDVLADKLAVYADLPDEKIRLDTIHGHMTAAADAGNWATSIQNDLTRAHHARAALDEATLVLAQQPDWDYLEGTAAAVEATIAEAAMAESAWQRGATLDIQLMDARHELADIVTPELDFETLDALVHAQDVYDTAVRQAQACRTTIELATVECAPNANEQKAEQEMAAETVCPLCEQVLVR